ncbi:murein biosynthesis integral membrane protein MurJ [Sphingomonas prati]|uniref:Probable lipid II flippase MurJ n=1 Tax=Sphingomonas prati TaxID=1843237 RepID=A0A7W9BV19_9SPHN|nr:murein biosynthesis integral membrane protein MurJ [Sphingomonas prati]MBB5730648.1 putative peptidoglycan lipid II flippase [Sphingomonas prati]GGE96296.1 putative lipid II flippase MurJ [Sphingomonas prati]
MSLVRNTATIGGFTLISRILGLVRDVLMARFVGAGFASDAFLVAWRLPNLFRALFAEGAFASAFVPMFNRTIAEAERGAEGETNGQDGLPAGRRFAEDVLSVLFPFLAVFTTLVMLVPGPVVWAITFGFRESGGAEKLALATELTRITFPYLMLISLVSLLGGILNSLGRFWVNAAAPVLLNLCMIAGLIFFRGATGIDTARTQAIAVNVSGVAQLAWLIWSCRRAGIVLRLKRPQLTPQVRKLLVIIWPAAIGAGAVQFNLMISTMLASGFLGEGAVSYLYYADRLNQLPLGLIGIGVGTAILPALSRQIGSGNDGAAVHTQNRAIELSLLLTLPATVALMLSATPLVRGLFQGLRFTAEATEGCAAALTAFSFGLPAYILIKVLTPGFYARSDTRTPVRIAMIAMVANLALNLGFVFLTPLGYVGLAFSTAAAAWLNVAMLYITLRRRNHFAVDAQLARRTVRLGAASVAMGAVLLLLNPLIDPYTAGPIPIRAAALTALIAAGTLTYAAAAFLFRAFSLAELKGLRKRG